MKDFNIVYCCSDYYAPHLGASMTSILENIAVKNSINFHILDFEISNENKRKLQEICAKYNALNHIFLFDSLDSAKLQNAESANRGGAE
ncbi:glycosyltransferase [Helicobacter sp. 23-1045]